MRGSSSGSNRGVIWRHSLTPTEQYVAPMYLQIKDFC